MDYYSLKRKQLQALCKQHNIPANSANSVLADNLSQLLNEKQKPTTRQRTCLKSPNETLGEGEPAVSKKEAKKVRFSPDNDLLEYELRSGKKHEDVVIERKSRRKSVANKVEKQVVNENAELIDDVPQKSVRLTRSGKDGAISNNEKKQGKKAAKDSVGKEPGVNLGKVTRSKVHALNKRDVEFDETKQSKMEYKDVEKKNESVKGPVVGSVRVTRSKAQSLIDDGIGSDVNPQLKKSSGSQVAKDAHNAEPPREIIDIPVRVTRTRGQILKQDNGNTVTNSQGEKKRTRKDMKSTDLRINSSNVNLHDNQELPRRKSLRTSGVETPDEDGAEKMRRGKQIKRNKESVAVPESQHHADNGPRQSRRNATKAEDSKVLNHIVSEVEIVNDKKVARSKHQRQSKLVQQPEKPSDHGDKKVVNRKKSGIQKVQRKGVDKPLVGKRESEKATVMVESSTRETRKSVEKTLSKEQFGNLSLIDEGFEDIENVTRSGRDASEHEIKAVVNPIGSPKSRKRRGTPIVEDQTVETEYVYESSRLSAPSSSKSDAKKQVGSSSKTPASRKNIQLDIQNAVPEVNKENSSKKRAKLSGTNQRYSENHSEKTSDKEAQISKLGNFELVEINQIESTPSFASHRRVTRSAVKTGGKEPNQSAIKEQPIGDAQFSLRKVARFRTDPAVNTAPGRVTRSRIKHRGNAAIIFSEKVDKRKRLSWSAHRKQPFDDTQISLPEGAEVSLNPDVDTIRVQSEICKTSESVKLPTIVLEEKTVMENLSPVSGENASVVESHTISNIKTIPVTMEEKPEVYESRLDDVYDGSHVQNETQEVSVKSTIFSEAEVQLALNSEKPVADENEMDLTKLGSTFIGQQIDLMAEEPAISIDKTVVMEENEAGSSAVCHVSVVQSDVKGKSKELEDQAVPSIIENVMQSVEDDRSYVPLAKGFMQDDLTSKYSLQNDSVDKHKVADNGEGDDENESVGVQNSLMNKPVSKERDVAYVVDVLKIDESENKDDTITSGQSINEHGELSTGKSVIHCLAMDTSAVEFDVVPSTGNDVHEVPILRKSDGEDEDANVTKKDEIDSMPLTYGNMLKDPVMSGRDGDDGGANVIECETDSLPSSAGNKFEESLLSGNEGEDGSANATDCQIDSLPLTSSNMIEDHALSGSDSKAESNPNSLTDNDVSDPSFLGKDDYDINRQPEPTLEPSPADDMIESLFSNNDMYDDVEADGGNNVHKELKTALEMANAPVLIKDVSSDFENDRLTSNDSCAMDDHNVGGENSETAPNENMHVAEISIRSCDQEPDQVFNVSANEVPFDTDVSASVRPFDSSMNIESSRTHAIAAITVDPLEESIPDISKEDVSNILGNAYDINTKNDSGNELKFGELNVSVQPKEIESFPPDMSKEQTSEKAEMTTGNVQEEHIVATVDLDLGLGGGKFMEDCSNHGVEELDSELVGIINSDENPSREENPPIVQTKERKDSDSPTFFNEDDRDKQGSTSVDWGDYSFEMEEFPNSVAENESDDALDKSRKASEFENSVGASSYSEENSRVAADMVNSVKNLEMASRNVANEKSSEEVDMLKENVNALMTDDVFNWSDSSLKSLFKTSAGTQISHVEDGQEGASGASSPSQDRCSSLKYPFKTPATTWIGEVGYGQDDAVDISNQDRCSSLAPATASISHVKDDKEDACRFLFPDDGCNRDNAKHGTAPHEFDHQWESLEGFDGETQGNATRHISEDVMYESIEDYSCKFFGDEVDHSSDGKDKHLELKGDQVDRTKQFNFSNEEGTSRHDTCDLKNNSIYSDEFKKKEESQLKGREPFDD